MLHQDLTQQILVSFFEVYNEVGRGFLESVYAESLRMALDDSGLAAQREVPVNVHFRGRVAGRFYADLVVERRVIIELKVAKLLAKEHESQLLHYLRATDVEAGLLLNFGSSPQFKRLLLTNDRKLSLGTQQPVNTRADPW